MIKSVLMALSLCTTQMQPLNDTVSYGTAVISAADGSEVAALLAVSDTAVDVQLLPSDKRAAWKDLCARVASRYAAADRRQRASLTGEMLAFQVGAARTDDTVWIRFADGSTTRAERVCYPTAGVIWRLCDSATNQYLAIVRAGDTSDLAPLFAELFKHPSDEEVAGRVSEKARLLKSNIEAMLEVNGQRQYLPKGSVTEGALSAELVALMPNLYGEGKQRLLQSLAFLESIREGNLKAGDPNLITACHLAAAPCDATALGLPVVLTTYHLKEGVIVRVRPEPPDPVTVSRFVGEEGWLQPRLDLEFKDEVSRLLSASE